MTANAKRFRTSIAAYCFMPNHFHLAVRQEEGGSISKCVQITFNVYTQAVNKQKKLSETLFQGKTQARHIDSDTYILQVIRYIHLNPVTAGFVKRPEDWEFSDYRDWVSGTTFRRFPEFRQREPLEGFSRFIFPSLSSTLPSSFDVSIRSSQAFVYCRHLTALPSNPSICLLILLPITHLPPYPMD